MAAAQIADANATLKTQAVAWRPRSPQQEEVQTTAKHNDNGYANEQDRWHVRASWFNGHRTAYKMSCSVTLPRLRQQQASASVRWVTACLSACGQLDIRGLAFQILGITFQSLPVGLLRQACGHTAGGAGHRLQPFGVWQELGGLGQRSQLCPGLPVALRPCAPTS
jgi:hypothetical protein